MLSGLRLCRGAAVGVILSFLLGMAPLVHAQHGPRTTLQSKYMGLALQGDLSGAEALLAEKAETDADRALLETFGDRFIARTDGLDLAAIEDPLVREALAHYQDYWRDALLSPDSRATREDRLIADLIVLLKEFGHDGEGLTPDNTTERLKEAIEARGYHAISGRTPPLLELMIWQTSDETKWKVALTDSVREVRVTFLDNFLSYGWSHFATFGAASTGGWATDDGLYAVRAGYDIESERFLNSFLKHETRHFADYEMFPNLKAPDLEYRAKLTELAFAEDNLKTLLGMFSAGAAKVKDAPHALASWYVVHNLSRELFHCDWPESVNDWEAIPHREIRAAARRLLAQNTKELMATGAEAAEGILTP